MAPAGNALTVFGAAPSPEVSFTGGPAEGGFGSADPTFRFVSTAGGSFECSLDGVASACASPLHLHHLGVGSHTFTVAVTGTPASGVTRSFVVDAIAPVMRVAAFNPLVTSHREASTHWSATDWGSGVRAFQVRTRVSHGGSPVPAWSVGSVGTATMRSFSVPRHAKRCISLRAVDRVGNWSSWSAAQCVRRR